MLKIRKFDIAFLIGNLGKFSRFNNFFPNLIDFSLFNFPNLDNFLDFLVIFLPSSTSN